MFTVTPIQSNFPSLAFLAGSLLGAISSAYHLYRRQTSVRRTHDNDIVGGDRSKSVEKVLLGTWKREHVTNHTNESSIIGISVSTFSLFTLKLGIKKWGHTFSGDDD